MAIYAPPFAATGSPVITMATVSSIIGTGVVNPKNLYFHQDVGFLAGTGPAFAKDVDDNPASYAEVEIYTNGSRRRTTNADADGLWKVENLDHTLVYDVVGRFSTFDAVISRDRIPKLMTLTSSPVLNETRSGQKVYRISLKNFRAPFTVNYNGNPITATTDQDTGIIEFFVGFDGTTYTATITDSTGRTYDYLVVAPSP